MGGGHRGACGETYVATVVLGSSVDLVARPAASASRSSCHGAFRHCIRSTPTPPDLSKSKLLLFSNPSINPSVFKIPSESTKLTLSSRHEIVLTIFLVHDLKRSYMYIFSGEADLSFRR